jgi:hypothetical protein
MPSSADIHGKGVAGAGWPPLANGSKARLVLHTTKELVFSVAPHGPPHQKCARASAPGELPHKTGVQ